jgi:hypothetical protein
MESKKALENQELFNLKQFLLKVIPPGIRQVFNVSHNQ